MYIIMEVQVFPEGNMSTPCYAYENLNSAESKYHAILSSAAVSSLPIHTAFMLTDTGQIIKSQSYTHEIEPEPEPEKSEETENQ